MTGSPHQRIDPPQDSPRAIAVLVLLTAAIALGMATQCCKDAPAPQPLPAASVTGQ